jgi:hypothetical protein
MSLSITKRLRSIIAALVGFGEYAKHLINLHPKNIVAVYDPDERLHGIHYRGIPVLPLDMKVECNLIACCSYELAYDVMRSVASLHPGAEVFVPSRLHFKSTKEASVFDQETLYRQIFKQAADAPISMMNVEKIKFLLELLRFGLRSEGHIVEMGSWQGGSTWFMAKLLQISGENRKLYAMDLFEKHGIDPTATVCLDEVRRRLSFYPYVHCIEGLVNDPACLAQIDPGPICFAHIDLGCVTKSVQFVWDRMAMGAPILLDNYGHFPATWRFDEFFEKLNTRVVRLPWSEQGIVFKQ